MRERLTDTLTNLAYAAVGIYALALEHFAVGAGLIVLAITSGAFHWYRTTATQQADEIGMYAALTALVGLVGGYPDAAVFAGFGMLAAFHERLDSFFIVGVLAGVAFVFVTLQSVTLALIAAGLFGIGLFVRNRWWWGHGAWHVLGASAYAVVLLCYPV